MWSYRKGHGKSSFRIILSILFTKLVLSTSFYFYSFSLLIFRIHNMRIHLFCFCWILDSAACENHHKILCYVCLVCNKFHGKMIHTNVGLRFILCCCTSSSPFIWNNQWVRASCVRVFESHHSQWIKWWRLKNFLPWWIVVSVHWPDWILFLSFLYNFPFDKTVFIQFLFIRIDWWSTHANHLNEKETRFY